MKEGQIGIVEWPKPLLQFQKWRFPISTHDSQDFLRIWMTSAQWQPWITKNVEFYWTTNRFARLWNDRTTIEQLRLFTQVSGIGRHAAFAVWRTGLRTLPQRVQELLKCFEEGVPIGD